MGRLRLLFLPGWLAIPASLVLIAGCRSPDPARAPVATAVNVSAEPDQLLAPDSDFWILTFFDLYCVACQQSAANFAALNSRVEEAITDRSVVIQGIGVGDTAFEIDVFLRRYPLGYPCLPDPDKAIGTVFSIRGTPTVLVIENSRDGRIEAYRHEGRFRSGEIEKVLEVIQRTPAMDD